MAAKKESDLFGFVIPLLIALGNIALFGLLFVIMHYFELVGADPTYFDDGTHTNMGYINAVVGFIGKILGLNNLEVPTPNESTKVSTLMYGACLGVAFISSFFAIAFANRRPDEAYEVTEAS